MSAGQVTRSKASGAPDPIPSLVTGDCLTAEEFDRRYAVTPEGFKAELIEGVVYVASPVSADHGPPQALAGLWLGLYWLKTPGIVFSDNETVHLDSTNRIQPDFYLRIEPEYGGRTYINADRYLVGAPELVVEIAASTVRHDLKAKLTAYARNEVLEYIVWRTRDRAIDWFRLHEGAYVPIPPDPEGIIRSTIFPGLWLDPNALISGDRDRIEAVARLGLASPDHAAFVARLAAARSAPS